MCIGLNFHLQFSPGPKQNKTQKTPQQTENHPQLYRGTLSQQTRTCAHLYFSPRHSKDLGQRKPPNQAERRTAKDIVHQTRNRGYTGQFNRRGASPSSLHNAQPHPSQPELQPPRSAPPRIACRSRPPRLPRHTGQARGARMLCRRAAGVSSRCNLLRRRPREPADPGLVA